MGGFRQRKLELQQSGVLVSASTAAESSHGLDLSHIKAQSNSLSLSTPVSVLDQTSTVPQLIDIRELCKILALQKSAVYNLVATGELSKPLKFGTSRRAASRWLLTDVIHFVRKLAEKR